MTISRGRARFGILVPFTNRNLEPDMSLMRPNGVSLHFARIGGYDEDAVPDLAQMQGIGMAELDEPLRLLTGVKPDVVMYGCTSATLTHGPDFDRALEERIRTNSGAKTVTAAGALVLSLIRLGVRRIAFASPYVSEINDVAVEFLSGSGFETVARSEVDERLDNDGQRALDPDAVFTLAAAADHPAAEAIVLSCTDMRAVETLDKLESVLRKPVICSNQALLFAALELLGFNDSIYGFGRLLAERKGGREELSAYPST
jgi:maleate isomerase/arylmalonate decarboxylase